MEKYLCLNAICNHQFEGPRGPVRSNTGKGSCPKCNGFYVKWLTYNQINLK